MKKQCPQHKPGVQTYPKRTIGYVWGKIYAWPADATRPPSQRGLRIYQRWPYRNYASGPIAFCAAIAKANKQGGANCMDSSLLVRGHAQWFISTKDAQIDSLRHEKRKWGHAIPAFRCWNPEKGIFEWWYCDRPPTPKGQGGYGKGVPKMPILKSQYLALFKGKVRVRKTYRATNRIITTERFEPFRIGR